MVLGRAAHLAAVAVAAAAHSGSPTSAVVAAVKAVAVVAAVKVVPAGMTVVHPLASSCPMWKMFVLKTCLFGRSAAAMVVRVVQVDKVASAAMAAMAVQAVPDRAIFGRVQVKVDQVEVAVVVDKVVMGSAVGVDGL